MSQEFDKARQQADKCLAQGDFAQAEAFFRHAAQIAETAFGQRSASLPDAFEVG